MAKQTTTTQTGRKVAGAIHNVSKLVGTGIAPDAAAQKVAEDLQLNKSEIRRVAEGFNQSSAWTLGMQRGGGQKVANQPLIHPEQVINSIFKPATQKAAAGPLTLNFPAGVVSEIGMTDCAQKAASAEKPERQDLNVAGWLGHCEALRTSLAESVGHAENRLHTMHQTMMGMVNKLAQGIDRLPEKDRLYYARLVVNGYHAVGRDLIGLVNQKTARGPIDIPQKTADHSVFPANELYTLTAEIVDKSYAFADAVAELNVRQKVAIAFNDTLSATEGALDAASSVVSSLRGRGQGDDADEEAMKVFSPEFYNQLREIRTQSTFNDVINRPELRDYPREKLLQAHNTVVQLMPAAAENPAVLRIMMKQMLTTGTDPDQYGLAQAVSINNDLDKGVIEREKQMLAERAQRWKEKDAAKRLAATKGGTKLKSEPFALLAPLATATMAGNDKGEKPKPEKPEKTEQPEKKNPVRKEDDEAGAETDAKERKKKKEQANEAAEATTPLTENPI